MASLSIKNVSRFDFRVFLNDVILAPSRRQTVEKMPTISEISMEVEKVTVLTSSTADSPKSLLTQMIAESNNTPKKVKKLKLTPKYLILLNFLLKS